MSQAGFRIHSRRNVSLPQIKQWVISHDPVLLNHPTGRKFVVMQAMYSEGPDAVRAQVEYGDGQITTVWLQMPVPTYETLEVTEIPGEDVDFDEMTLT